MPDESLQFTEAAIGDVPNFEKLARAAMAAFYEAHQMAWDSEAFCTGCLASENYRIERAGEVVGVLRLARENEHVYVFDLHVEPHARNQGIGTQALHFIQSLATQSGKTSIRMRAFKTNPAIRLYERVGFKVVGEDERFVKLEKCLASSECARQAHWDRFYWADGKDQASGKPLERVALIVPVAVPGCATRLYAQLDTGANRTVISGPALQQLPEACRKHIDLTPTDTYSATLGPDPTVKWLMQVISLSFALGSAPVTTQAVTFSVDYMKEDDDFHFGAGPDQGMKIGTIGMDYFQDKQLLIDYPRERFMVLDKDQPLPADLRDTMTYFPVGITYGKPLLPLTIGGHTSQAWFDTGSSMFPIILAKPAWQQLTGRQGDEPSNTVVVGNAWGSPMRLIGAPLRETLGMGHRTWDAESKVEVYFIDWQEQPDGCVQVFGNALFFNSVVVLDVAKQRFGICRQPPTNAPGVDRAH